MEPAEPRRKVLFVSEVSKTLCLAMRRVAEDFYHARGLRNPLADLRLSQVLAVLSVMRLEPCGLSDLVRELHVSKSSASLMVKRLVDKNILVREIDPGNRRCVVISIEPSVRELLEAADGSVIDWLSRIAGSLGVDRVNQWHQVMTRLRAVLEVVS